MDNFIGRLSLAYSVLKLFCLHDIFSRVSSWFLLASKSYDSVRSLVSKTNNVVTDGVFPPEIISEILSWLPVNCLGREMAVCKEWYALIKDRHFIEKNMRRSPITYVFYITIPSSNVNLCSKYIYISACDGLLLEKNTTTQKYVISNKATKQFLELPDPHKGSHSVFFSYVPSTSNYKFVSIYDDKNSTDCFEVLSFEDDELLWRHLEVPTMETLNQNRKKISVVSTGDAVHCVRVIAVGATIVEEVISLDMGSEQFTVTNLPRGQYNNWEMVWPINFNGKLSILDRMGGDLCGLVLEDYKTKKWGEKKTLIPLASMKSLEDEYGTVSPHSIDQFGFLWFWVQDKMFIRYDMKTGCVLRKVPGRECGAVTNTFYLAQTSLVRLKGMQPEAKTPKQSSSNQV